MKETMLPNSPAIPLPIPLPAAPVKPCQLIDIHEINDIERRTFRVPKAFSPCCQGSADMPLADRRFGQRCDRERSWSSPYAPESRSVS